MPWHETFTLSSRQNLQTFDISNAFLTLTNAKLSTLKTVLFFGPPCICTKHADDDDEMVPVRHRKGPNPNLTLTLADLCDGWPPPTKWATKNFAAWWWILQMDWEVTMTNSIEQRKNNNNNNNNNNSASLFLFNVSILCFCTILSSRTVRTNSLPDLILIRVFNPQDLYYRGYKKKK